MAEAPEAPQGGALSIDEAVALLDRRQEEGADDADGLTAETPDDDHEYFAGAASAPEDADGRAEDPDDGEDEAEAGDEGDADRLEPPKYWSKEAKARFAELDPDLQAVVLAQEGPREEAAARAKAETRAVRDEALQQVELAAQLLETLSEALPEAYGQWRAGWQGTPDWAEIARTHGVEAADMAREQFAAEQAHLAQAQAAVEAAGQARARLVAAREVVALRELEPELLDEERGDELRAEIAEYLAGKGVDPDALPHISAVEIHLARKAMLWDRAQDRARSSTVNHRPAPASTRPLARGGASTGPADPKARRAAQAKSRFAKSRSVEDAVALLNAQGD
jgi:hypothetical protein